MKLNPQQAPLYGDCIITVLLTEDDKAGSDDVVFYLVFTGSAVQHCTSTRKLDSGTLETIAPGHDCCETVKVSLCAAKQGSPLLVVAEDSLQFVQDEAYDAAQFLATCAGNQQALNFTRFLDKSRPPAGDVDFLDEKVALAFRHLKLPAGWNVLGADHTANENVPRETLMHFAVRLGLLRLTWFLLQQPGGRGALSVPNREGATPVSLALEKGYQKLHQLLTEEGASEPDSWSALSHTVHSGEYCVKYHRGLNIYTLTVETKEGAGSSMESDVVCLQRHIQNHQHMNTSEHPHPEQETSCEDCNLGQGAEGHTAVLSCHPGEMTSEGNQGDASVPLALAAMQVLALACPEEDRQLKVPLDTPKDSLKLEEVANPESSCESQNTVTRLHKEEEVESAFAVEAGAILKANDGRLSPLAGLHSAVGLPPCGNTSQEVGMTTPSVALEEGHLCGRGTSDQEVQTAEVKEAGSVPSKPPTSRKDQDASMGQGECRSCTGTADAATQQRVANGERDCEPAGAMETLLPAGAVLRELAANFPGDSAASAARKGEGVEVVDLQSDAPAGSGAGVSIFESGSSKTAGSETPSDSGREDFTKCPEGCELPGEEAQSTSPSPATEATAAAVNVTGISEPSPKRGPGVEVHECGQKPEGGNLPTDTHSDANVENDELGRTFVVEPKAPGVTDKRTEPVAEVGDKQKDLEPMQSGTETASCGCGGSAASTSLSQGASDTCDAQKGAVNIEEQVSAPVLCADSADASELQADSLSPPVSPLAQEEPLPLPKQAEVEESSRELDRFSKSAQEFIALASSLLVDEAIQQAQLIVAQESKARAAPVGQEASLHHQDLALPLCGKGTECAQDNVMGTPSAIHNRESKQIQEVGAAAAAETATEPTAAAAEGSPVCSEETAETLSLVDHQGENQEGFSTQLPGSGQELPGKEEALLEGPAPAAVVQSPPPCRQGKELGGNESNAKAGLKGEASSSGTDENAKAAVSGDALPGPGPPEDGSLCPREAPFPDATLNQELEPSCPDQCAAPPPGGVSDLMEAPLVTSDRPVAAILPREGGEEVENVPSRVLLQPIAEEPPCDGDPGSEMFFLASEGEARPGVEAAQMEGLAQPSNGTGEESQAEQDSQLLQPSPCLAVELLGKGEAAGSVQEADGPLVDNVDKTVTSADQATAVAEACGPLVSLAGSSVEIAPLAESRSEAQRATDAGSIPNGEVDLSLQPGGLAEGAASPALPSCSPVAEAVQMKTEEEVGFLRDLAESSASEGMINRESWSPVETAQDPSLLEPKHPCRSAESDNFLEDGLSGDCTSSQDILKRRSESESDLFPLSGDGMDEVDFGKQPEEEQSAGDSTSSSFSADDTLSLERNSSLGSDISLPQALGISRPKDRYSLDGSCFNMATSAEGQDGEAGVSGELDEELDSITEVPPPASALKSSMRPLSPFRRHSWGPGKNSSNEAEMNHRSSMRVLGDGVRKPPTHRRSLSWCPSDVQCTTIGADLNGRSYSLEGLAGEGDSTKKPPSSLETATLNTKDLRQSPLANDERGSLVSLTEEELELEQGAIRSLNRQIRQRSQPRAFSFTATPVSPPLTKSMSLMTIGQAGPDTQGRTRPSRRISFSFSISPLIPKSKTVFSIGSSSSDEDEELDSNRSFSSTSSSLTQSICEESGNFLPPSPSRKDLDSKSGTKVSRTFSYLKNKMVSGKKSKEKEKDKEKTKEKDRDSKEKDKKMINGHLFSATPTVGPVHCSHCLKPFNKDSFACGSCGILVHKNCKESVVACAKAKMKKGGGLLVNDTSSLPTVIMRNKPSQPKERPRSAILAPDENTVTSMFNSRRSQHNPSLSKSVSIQNIAGVGNDENILSWKFLSQSTDSLNKISRVNESMESLTDEGADMNEGQLMGDFETDSKQLEAQSWSQVVDAKFLRQQKKDVVKRQDVIYELMQTEMHHVRTLKIMSDVYSRGMVQELQYEQQMVEKVFPCLDDLLNIHTQFFQRILERKKESLADRSEKNFVIKRIGDILVNQFSGENAEKMKKTYGKFCGHHNEAVNYFKDLHSKEKRFQAFIKKKMSSSVVRRLGIPECILLVTQRITKYPVLLQRILQHTKENDEEHQDLVLSLNLVKEVITAVNSKVSNYEKKMRLNEIYTRTDSKSIMRMKSGQMFAREDLRRRKFVRDGPISLRNAASKLKEVQAVLLSDVLIFLQEKDQKYVFASLDQKSTVISLKKLIVREVAHEEKGLFLISMGGKDPEMVEVRASSKEERNSWIQSIQDTMNTMDKEEDEGIPSESEEEKRVLDTKARELKEQLHQKDQQIITLLEEKEKIFRDMTDCSGHEDSSGARTLFRANTEEAPKGESVMKSVITEVELLQGLVSRSLGSALGQQMSSLTLEQEGVGPVSLPRRAETFGGFDSHQMNVCKGVEKVEGDDVQDLRRTESDSVLKKGGTANLMFVLKRNNEQVLQSITHLHSLLGMLQAVVVQQDTYIEDQKLLLTERALTRSSLRPNSLIEQEKQRSLEKQRQELANLQKQQAQHQEEKRKREREWEAREKEVAEREARLAQREEQLQKGHHILEKEQEELQQKKATYQLDLEHLRAAQKQLEKEKEQLKRDMEQISQLRAEPNHSPLSNQHGKMTRTPSLPVPDDSSSRQQGHLEKELSASPKRNSLTRTHKEKGAFHLLGTTTLSQANKAADGQGQVQNRLFGLAKPKEKKEKKKKGKGHRSQPAEAQSPEAAPEGEEIFC
ncbi:A-kinase anchor protein 13 isoform X1 [Podarcis lilfordi]|uniref:A-kinase anchor protein 13 isoform X1 n=1 Tax=Podarcis lilfordi TaxID=74358 RepID=A0AA35LBH4_9SAUR|nr:A-kinase anchor protein 13 isoform X1 [Podarcis lilfordi]